MVGTYVRALICSRNDATRRVMRRACAAAFPESEIVEVHTRREFEAALHGDAAPDAVISTFSCNGAAGAQIAEIVERSCPRSSLLFLGELRHEEELLELVAAGRADYVLQGARAEARLVARIRASCAARPPRDARPCPRMFEAPDFAESLLEAVDTVVVILGRDGKILKVNRACRELTGYGDDELVGRLVWELLVPPEERADVQKVFNALADGEFPSTHVNRWVSKSGNNCWIRWNNTVVRGEAGNVLYVVGTGLDISDERTAQKERAALEEQLLQAAKLESLGVLAGGIAHDFNNLLMGILGSAELIQAELPPESPCVEDVEGIKEAALRGAQLTKQMLAYAGRGPVSLAPIDLNDVLNQTRSLLNTALAPSVVLRYELAPHIPKVRADGAQIEQLLVALVTNAAEAIGERSGYITIATGMIEVNDDFRQTMVFPVAGQNGCHVFLRVADTGPGIQPDVLPRIFEPFFTTKFMGRGLGLASVAGIVRSHGGGIRVDNQTGSGCSFLVVFPCIPDGHTGETTVGGTIPRLSEKLGKKSSPVILVADDEVQVRRVTRRLLERAGYRVIEAQDGREALSVFLRYGPEISLAILDLAMPHKSGAETATELRTMRPDLPIIVSSGYDESNLLSRGAPSVGVTFLQKPFNADSLYRALRKALDRKTRPPGTG
ncbi:MAG: PAS domain S-box protein [Kiritimatiellaeota bacterium]|nr:PAS domain S-box protein [Kiritimatiellota bacterium]